MNLSAHDARGRRSILRLIPNRYGKPETIVCADPSRALSDDRSVETAPFNAISLSLSQLSKHSERAFQGYTHVATPCRKYLLQVLISISVQLELHKYASQSTLRQSLVAQRTVYLMSVQCSGLIWIDCSKCKTSTSDFVPPEREAHGRRPSHINLESLNAELDKQTTSALGSSLHTKFMMS